MNNSKVEKMIEIGGAERKCKSYHRIYFDALKLARLECKFKNGTISSASLYGHDLNVSFASELYSALKNGEFWYDVKNELFGGVEDTRIWRVSKLLMERIQSQIN